MRINPRKDSRLKWPSQASGSVPVDRAPMASDLRRVPLASEVGQWGARRRRPVIESPTVERAACVLTQLQLRPQLAGRHWQTALASATPAPAPSPLVPLRDKTCFSARSSVSSISPGAPAQCPPMEASIGNCAWPWSAAARVRSSAAFMPRPPCSTIGPRWSPERCRAIRPSQGLGRRLRHSRRPGLRFLSRTDRKGKGAAGRSADRFRLGRHAEPHAFRNRQGGRRGRLQRHLRQADDVRPRPGRGIGRRGRALGRGVRRDAQLHRLSAGAAGAAR